MNGPLIRVTMLERGFDAEALAKKAKLGIATVYNVLAEKPVSLRTAFKVSDALRLPMKEIAPELVKRYGLPKEPKAAYKRR